MDNKYSEIVQGLIGEIEGNAEGSLPGGLERSHDRLKLKLIPQGQTWLFDFQFGKPGESDYWSDHPEKSLAWNELPGRLKTAWKDFDSSQKIAAPHSHGAGDCCH
jgi:hypothetical protein